MVFIPPDGGSKPFRLRRSVLFLPASNARAIEKAKTLSADCVIFDLEDSVAEEARKTAHANLLELVKGADFGGRERIIRTPATGCPGFDAAFDVAIQCAPDAILLPKVETLKPLQTATAMLEKQGSKAALWIMIETPMALMNLNKIAGSGPPLSALVVGPNDLAKATGVKMEGGRPVMLPWLMQVVAAARAHGLHVLDGVYNAFRDLDGLAAECAQGAAMGFDGKTLIHPAQIETANSAFSPSQEELARAEAIVSAFAKPENTHKGAIQIDGAMVERLHLEQAERLLAAAKTTRKTP